jgi:hypothetical protein
MKELILVLAQADHAALGNVRSIAGLKVGIQFEKIWLRGIPAKGETDLRIRQLPAMERYVLKADDQLFQIGKTTPVAYLPRLQWQEIKQYIPLELPVAAYAGRSTEVMDVKLVPSGREENPVALRCRLEHLQVWAETAAEVRIRALRLAGDLEGNVWVMGHPLPSIPGTGFWSCQGLLLPAGMALEFPILAPILLDQYNPGKDSLVVVQGRGEEIACENIPLDLFVAATRSGIRLSPLVAP